MTTMEVLPSRERLIQEVIEQEMTADGKVDHDRVLAAVRARVRQLNAEDHYVVTRDIVIKAASNVRSRRGLANKQLGDRVRAGREAAKKRIRILQPPPMPAVTVAQIRGARALLRECGTFAAAVAALGVLEEITEGGDL